MDFLRPLQDATKWLLDVSFRYTLKKAAKVPVAIAQSTTLMRLVSLLGLAMLSLALLAVTVHIVTVREAVRLTEDLATQVDLNIRFRISSALKVAEATEWLFKNNSLSDSQEHNSALIQTLPWVKSSEISGVALISDSEVRVLYGRLDPGDNSPSWDRTRWDHLRHTTAIEVTKGTLASATVFLGIERRYRTKEEFSQGRQLTGSLVLSRAWKGDNDTWQGVAILLPVQSFNSLLRLGNDEYSSGNYDYLVDNDGFLLAHSNPFLIYGTDADGRDLRGATNYDEVGKFPLNTRDSDWISGSDTLNKAFGSMIKRRPTTVVYRNLRNQNRLTTFRLVDLGDTKGKAIGIVSGRGLTALEALTVPLLLKRTSQLSSILWLVVGLYLVLASGWLALVEQFTSLHMDLLSWARFMSPSTAISLGLLPIPKGKLRDYHLANIVAIALSLEVTELSTTERDNALEVLDKLCTRLQEDGWITYVWTFSSLIACRQLTDSGEGGKVYFWSPTNVVDYLGTLPDLQLLQIRTEHAGSPFHRVVYGIGGLHIRTGRLGATQRANISLLGKCVIDIIHHNEELGAYDPSSQGVLMYPIEEAADAGLQIVGDRVTVNSRTYGKLQLARKGR